MHIFNGFNLGFFQLSKRLGRVNYIGLTFFWFMMCLANIYLFEMIPKHEVANILFAIITMIFLLNIFTLKVRRMFDLNLTGKYVIFFFIPVVNFIFLAILCFFPGTKTTNQFGEVPPYPTLLNIILVMLIPVIGMLFFMNYHP